MMSNNKNSQEDAVPSIPIMHQPASLMLNGPNGNNLAARAKARHPVDDLQRTLKNNNSFTSSKLEYVRHVYGSGLAMRLATEQKIARQQELDRPPALVTSNLYLETVTGNDIKLDFCDFLGLPQNQPNVGKEDPHAILERRLGMSL
jgi:Proteasome maturation factor UMP1